MALIQNERVFQKCRFVNYKEDFQENMIIFGVFCIFDLQISVPLSSPIQLITDQQIRDPSIVLDFLYS